MRLFSHNSGKVPLKPLTFLPSKTATRLKDRLRRMFRLLKWVQKQADGSRLVPTETERAGSLTLSWWQKNQPANTGIDSTLRWTTTGKLIKMFLPNSNLQSTSTSTTNDHPHLLFYKDQAVVELPLFMNISSRKKQLLEKKINLWRK